MFRGKDACSFVDCEISCWKPGDETDVEEKRFVVTMKGTAEFVSGIHAIINVERFSCLERMLGVTAFVLKGKVDELIDIKNLMKETL